VISVFEISSPLPCNQSESLILLDLIGLRISGHPLWCVLGTAAESNDENHFSNNGFSPGTDRAMSVQPISEASIASMGSLEPGSVDEPLALDDEGESNDGDDDYTE
jgi:hypothetical protein